MTKKNIEPTDAVTLYAAPDIVTLYSASPVEYGYTGDKWIYTGCTTHDDSINEIKEDIKEMKRILNDLLERLKRIDDK